MTFPLTRLYFDGGFGTMLQKMGLKGGEAPELWNTAHPDRIIALHKSYLSAGANIITANTFGINRDKYPNYADLISAAMECANEAKKDYPCSLIAFDVGPTGRLMKPLGDLDFEEAVSLFSDNIKLASELGADIILIETMNDSLETKASVVAAKECSDLPVFVTNAYDRSGKLMTGADPEAMIAMLEGLGVDALGMNCSFGPDVMLELIDRFTQNTSLPIIANPNAGLPRTENGQTVYDISPEEFSDYMAELARKGVQFLGGCCGTTPDYIRLTVEKTKNIPLITPEKKAITAVSSYTHAVKIHDRPVLIGERINPTGKPKLKEALRSQNMSYILGEAIAQAESGAHILDINVGLPEIDEVKLLKEVILAVQAVTDLPLQLDSADPKALEAAMRVYNGKPLINSVNGKAESMDAIFPLVKKYGGTVIALTMDETGIPETAEGRLEIAERIVNRAAEYGISSCDIIVDPLCLAVSSDSKSALVTLKAVDLMASKGLKTSLGVSNISFGLPERERINTAFFALALEKGLNCAIMNPRSAAMMSVYRAFLVLHGLDEGCLEYIAYVTDNQNDSQPQANTASTSAGSPDLIHAIVKGLKTDAAALARELLKTVPPIDVINKHIIPALNDIGGQFEAKKAYLPQLLMSADAAVAAFAEVRTAIPKEQSGNQKSFILATVQGDIHDIGKNIVKVMLESYGFKVYDLGRDVPPEKVLDAVKETGCRLVGLSALMTTTLPSMEKTVKLLKAHDPKIKTVVGGAVLNREYTDMIGADFYAKDAMDTVRYAKNYYNS